MESLIKKIDRCANNPENSSTTKISECIPCGYLQRVIYNFRATSGIFKKGHFWQSFT